MTLPLMPKATAVWLVENTTLTFDQIAAFCGLHPLEVAGIADDEVAIGIQGIDPISRGQLTREAIEASEADTQHPLELAAPRVQLPPRRASGPRYTPVSKRQDRPNAIAWLLRFHPELSDAQLSRLVGTTKPTITAIRDRTHWNIVNIRHQDPVSLGLCTQTALDEAVTKARARERAKEAKAAAKARRDKELAAEAAAAAESEAPAKPAVAPPAEAAPAADPSATADILAEPAVAPPAEAVPAPDSLAETTPSGAGEAAPPGAPVPALTPVWPPPAVVPPAVDAEPATPPEAAPAAVPDPSPAAESAPDPGVDAAPVEEAPPPGPEDRETP